jgi:hypothetical protein
VITLTWTPLAGALGYNVYVADSVSGPFLYAASVEDAVYTAEVAPGEYFYQVAAFGDFGLSNPSTALHVVVEPCL